MTKLLASVLSAGSPEKLIAKIDGSMYLYKHYADEEPYKQIKMAEIYNNAGSLLGDHYKLMRGTDTEKVFKIEAREFKVIFTEEEGHKDLRDIYAEPEIVLEAMANKDTLFISVPSVDVIYLVNKVVPFAKEDQSLLNMILSYVSHTESKQGKKSIVTSDVKNLMLDGKYTTPEQLKKITQSDKRVLYDGKDYSIQEFWNWLLMSMAPAIVRDNRTGTEKKNEHAFYQRGVSDCSIAVGTSIKFRRGKDLVSFKDEKVGVDIASELKSFLLDTMTEHKRNTFYKTGSVKLAYQVHGYGRFRITIVNQRGTIAMSIRRLPDTFIPIELFMLPSIVSKELFSLKGGLYIISGAPNSGKTSLIATIVDEALKQRNIKVMTFEEPIEYLFNHYGSLVTQTEIGEDIVNSELAVEVAVTSDMDILYFPEIRNFQQLDTAASLAAAGKKVLCTMHSGSVYETLSRAFDFIPPAIKESKQKFLIDTVAMIINQVLIPRKEGGLLPLHQALVFTEGIKSNLKTNFNNNTINSKINEEKGGGLNFDKSLITYYERYHLISKEVLNEYLSNPEAYAKGEIQAYKSECLLTKEELAYVQKNEV